MEFDALYYPYPSRRSLVYGKKGMVATSQPLAAQAGLDMLKQGGNAVDAAVAAAACLTVVEPTSNGVGGDAFALVWKNNKLHGLNASGPAPLTLSGDKLRQKGCKVMPEVGWIPVTVPGVPAGWAELSRRFGRLPFKKLLGPAMEYAENGYPVSPVISKLWQLAFQKYGAAGEAIFASWQRTFASTGRSPEPGEIWRCKELARTLGEIGETGGESFYRGRLAEVIADYSRKGGGYLSEEDLAGYQPEWVEPISLSYRGYEVWEIPPNGHGLVALMALNILKGFDMDDKENPETYHRQFEAMKLAFADGRHYIADPSRMKVGVEALLSDGYGEERRRMIGKEAKEPAAGRPDRSGTVYLAAADGEGNMVSYIQSNYMGFGSGLVVPGTGIALHNRGCNFSLEPEHANYLTPGKKPYHTIIPGFLTRQGIPVGPFGVMGGFVQPQGHVQMVMNRVDFGLNPQASLDAPRWQWTEGKSIEVEHLFSEEIAEALVRRGHILKRPLGNHNMGRGQIIWRDESGVLAGGTEPRTDGGIAVW